jgi:hypothetical protein
MLRDGSKETHSPVFAWGVTLLALALIMSLYAYVRLSTNPRVFEAAVVAVILLDVGLLFADGKTLSRFDVGFDLEYLATLLSVVWGAFADNPTISLHSTPVVLITTIFYRPKLLNRGNRRLAFLLGSVILGVVAPVAFGWVKQRDVIGILSFLYAMLVCQLWVFCSRISRPST